MTFTYGWDRCDVASLVCLPIVGATSSGYTVSTADAGSTLRAEVTATNAAGSATASSQPTAVVTVPLPVTPPPVGGPTVDATLGGGKTNTSTLTMKLKTAAAAAPGSRIVLFLSWAHRTRTLASVAGGGLTWSVDVQASDASDNNNHGAIASAYAPDGLPSGTVITATFSAAVVHGFIAAVSFTGIASSDPVDTATSTVQGGVAAWNATLPSARSGDLVVGWTNLDAVTGDTANPSVSELVDMSDADYWGSATAVYTVAQANGPATVSGTWARAGGSTGNVTVAVAYRPGS